MKRPHEETTSLPVSEAVSGPLPGKYVVDRGASRVAFRAKAFCLMWVSGTLPVAEGGFRIERGGVSGSGELDAAGVSTGIAARDWHLRTSHYLHTKAHPRISVTIENADLASSTVDATIIVRGESKPVRLTLDGVEASGDDIRFHAHVDLDRTGIPMLPPLAGVSRKVTLTIELLARRRES